MCVFGKQFSLSQVINKVGDTPFTSQDEKIFSSYLQFCGIGLRNAHLYEKSQLEVKRNQVLLDLARMIFEEQSTIEHVVLRILTHTHSLIQCQRVQVRNLVTFFFFIKPDSLRDRNAMVNKKGCLDGRGFNNFLTI